MIQAIATVAREGSAAGLRPAFLFGANANLAADDREFARHLVQATGGAIELLHATSEAGWLSAIASARLMVSGRFHHSIAAAWLGTPFIALDSNTPKMDGLMQTLRVPARLNAASPSLSRDLSVRMAEILQDPSIVLISATVRAEVVQAAQRNFVD
jgi:polysaccharide pyruvyl transferase WcaK-like protein